MAYEQSIRRYRQWYGNLLHLYPAPYYERFGEGMEQTFTDLLRERTSEKRGVFRHVAWMFLDTFLGIMKENLLSMFNKHILIVALVTALLLCIPLVAMQFTSDVLWTLRDFIFAGALIFGTGCAYELVSRKGGNAAYRGAVGVALAATFLLIWVNAAVGLIGDGPVNILYLVVPTVGFLGALIVGFKARAMANVLFAMAIVQMLIPIIALTIVRPDSFSPGVVPVFGLNAFFTVLFVGSALLFRRAAR